MAFIKYEETKSHYRKMYIYKFYNHEGYDITDFIRFIGQKKTTYIGNRIYVSIKSKYGPEELYKQLQNKKDYLFPEYSRILKLTKDCKHSKSCLYCDKPECDLYHNFQRLYKIQIDIQDVISTPANEYIKVTKHGVI